MSTTRRRGSDASTTRFDVVEGGDAPVDEGRRLELAISALRARVDEEFKISERLAAKARQAFALTAGFFAIVQTVALARLDEISGPGRVVVLGFAIVAGGLLGLTAHRVVVSEDLRAEKDIDPAAIESWARDKDDREFGRLMVVHLREVADRRTSSNEQRAIACRGVIPLALWTLVFTGGELLVAVVFRL